MDAAARISICIKMPSANRTRIRHADADTQTSVLTRIFRNTIVSKNKPTSYRDASLFAFIAHVFPRGAVVVVCGPYGIDK
eukprot:scaffold81944_cov38-Prasinocladus_malaysianus.AAC.2